MKELKLFQKELLPKDESNAILCPSCGKPVRIPREAINSSSVDLLRVALEGSEINRKGLARIGQVLKILDKIQKAEDEKTETLVLEDAEFIVVHESIDKFVWLPLALRFKEFFEEIQRVKEVK